MLDVTEEVFGSKTFLSCLSVSIFDFKELRSVFIDAVMQGLYITYCVLYFLL